MFIELKLTQIITSGKSYQTQQLSNHCSTLLSIFNFLDLRKIPACKICGITDLSYLVWMKDHFSVFGGWSTPMTWLFHSAYCLYLQNSWANIPSRPFYLFIWKEVLFFLIDQHSCQLFCYQISSSVSCGTNHCLRFLTSKSYQRLFLLILELHDVHCFSSGD